jgi:hypothetical protein
MRKKIFYPRRNNSKIKMLKFDRRDYEQLFRLDILRGQDGINKTD